MQKTDKLKQNKERTCPPRGAARRPRPTAYPFEIRTATGSVNSIDNFPRAHGPVNRIDKTPFGNYASAYG